MLKRKSGMIRSRQWLACLAVFVLVACGSSGGLHITQVIIGTLAVQYSGQNLRGDAAAKCGAAPAGCNGNPQDDTQQDHVTVNDATSGITYTISTGGIAYDFLCSDTPPGTCDTAGDVEAGLLSLVNAPNQVARYAVASGSIDLEALEAGRVYATSATDDGGNTHIGAAGVRMAGGDILALFWQILASSRGPDMYYFNNVLNIPLLGDITLGPAYHVTADETINCNSTSITGAGLGTPADGTISYDVEYTINVLSDTLNLLETIAFSNCRIQGDWGMAGGSAMSTLLLDGTLTLDYDMPSNIAPALSDAGTISGQITAAGDLDGDSMTSDPFWAGTLNVNRYWTGEVQDWRQTPPVPSVTLGRNGGMCWNSTIVFGADSQSDLDDSCSDASQILRPVF